MATSKIVVNSLDVGQGCSTFVEVYEGLATLKTTILIDLGSSKSTKAARESIGYMYGILSAMGTPTIDLLVVSHKDRDHRNLLMELFEKFTKGTLRINSIRYGGRRNWYSYKKRGSSTTVNLFDEIVAQCTVPFGGVCGFNIAATDYNSVDKEWYPFLWVNNDVAVSLVMVNAPIDTILETVGSSESSIVDNPSGERVNAMSVVCSVYFDGRAFIASGDAEFPTFSAINTALSGVSLNYVDFMSLPHHGSRKTTFGLPKTDAPISGTNRTLVNTFAGIINAKTLVASADTMFGHPSLEVIELFAAYADATIWYTDPVLGHNRHVLTANIDVPAVYTDGTSVPSSSWLFSTRSFVSTLNVYSTLYYTYLNANIDYVWSSVTGKPVMAPFNWNGLTWKQRSEIPYGASWVYTKVKGVGTTLTRKDNRLFAAATPKAAELRAAQVVTRRICTPATGTSTPTFSRSFGRRIA